MDKDGKNIDTRPVAQINSITTHNSPNAGARMIKRAGIIGLLGLAAIFCFYYFSAPDVSCASNEVRSTLGKLVKKGLKQEVGAWGQIFGGRATSINEIIDNVEVKIDQIISKKESAKGCSCQAVVTMAASGQPGSTFAINYSTSLTDKKDLYVELDSNTLLGKLIFGGVQ